MGNFIKICQPASKQPKLVKDGKFYIDKFKCTSIVESVCDDDFQKELQIGKSSPHYRNKEANSQWQKILRNIDQILLEEVQMNHYYQDELSLEQDRYSKLKNEQIKQFQVKYSFVNDYHDVQALCFYIVQQETLQDMVILGPPQRMRWSCWKTLLLYDQQNINYENYLNDGPFTNVIKLDVDRTLVSHTIFQNDGAKIGQPNLFRVLQALSNYYPEVGYSQGMNVVAGYLLYISGCDEKNTFRSLVKLMEIMKFSYCKDMPLIDLISKLVHHQLRKYFPLIEKRLLQQNIPDSFWIAKVVLTLFIDCVKMSEGFRLWDYLIVRGILKGIPELIIGIIDDQNEIMTQCTMDTIQNIFQLISDYGLIVYAANNLYQIDDKIVNKYRKQFNI